MVEAATEARRRKWTGWFTRATWLALILFALSFIVDEVIPEWRAAVEAGAVTGDPPWLELARDLIEEGFVEFAPPTE